MKWLLALGGTSDIAHAIAYRFAAEGYYLYLAARRPEDLEHDVQDLRLRYDTEAKAVPFDALDYTSHRSFYDNLPTPPVGVVCALGYLGNQKRAEGDFEEAKCIIETNALGCMSILNVVANDFEKRGEGFIIGISSVAGDRGRQSNYFYGSAKSAFTAYLSGLRNRLHHSGVTVITVKPGFVDTRMTRELDLPALLTASPEQVAEDVYRAFRKRKDVVYIKSVWRMIMWVIRALPERLFKRLRL